MSRTVDVTTPSDREIRVERVFDAPAQLVFDFHTRPEHVRRWLLGPPGWTMPVCEIDLRVGGTYHYRWRSEETGDEFGARGTYREIDAPKRIVHTESMEGIDGEMLCTTTFVETDGKTTLAITMELPSREARDQALQTGMTDGMAQSYDLLEKTMAE